MCVRASIATMFFQRFYQNTCITLEHTNSQFKEPKIQNYLACFNVAENPKMSLAAGAVVPVCIIAVPAFMFSGIEATATERTIVQ